MTTVTIPLDKNPDLAALVADKEPGDWVELRASIKAKDDQTLTLRLEECDDCDKPDNGDDEEEEADDTPEEEKAENETPPAEESMGKRMAAKLQSSGM